MRTFEIECLNQDCGFLVRGISEKSVELTTMMHVAMHHHPGSLSWDKVTGHVEIGATFEVREEGEDV